MRAVRTRRRFVLALILGPTAGRAEDMSKPGAGELPGQGSKDYWGCQTIKNYQRKTTPAIKKSMRRLLTDDGGQHYAAEDANELALYETKTNGRKHMNAVYETQASVSPTRVRTITKETIGKAGLKIGQ